MISSNDATRPSSGSTAFMTPVMRPSFSANFSPRQRWRRSLAPSARTARAVRPELSRSFLPRVQNNSGNTKEVMMKSGMVAVGILAVGVWASPQEGSTMKREYRTLTHSLVLNAPKAKVFEFLSKEENLPKWAVVFCRTIEKRDDRWWVKTPQGEMLFRIEADAKTGVLDMFV